MSDSTPKSMRLQIGLFGRTNVGKSSFMNLVAGQNVAITSPEPGTTTDVVEKAMELLPLGPVVFLDTGGVNDTTVLGEERVRRSRLAMDRADVAVIITEPDAWSDHEAMLVRAAASRGVPCLAVVNKVDMGAPSGDFLARVRRDAAAVVCVSCVDGNAQNGTVDAFKQAVLDVLPESFRRPPTLVGDLVPAGGVVVLVVPIDLQAPKGRLILPQVHTIRDALDHDGAVLVVKEREYPYMIENLKQPPALVVCDSQVVQKMVADTPTSVPCTTFSILFARFKGDLNDAARGVSVIDRLHDGDRVLVAEACSHHALQDDIGRVKIPRWLRQFTGAELDIQVYSGRDYPPDLGDYRLVIHCGACMLTRHEMLLRMARARTQRVPVTNYGLCISHVQGVLRRVLSPFPSALEAYIDGWNPNNEGQ